MDNLDMVFWQDEEEGQEESLLKLKLLLCCNATKNEDWLKSQLPDFEEAGRAKNITELRKVLKANETIHLAIIMRKTGQNGVDKPEDFAKVIREHSPDAQIFIIVGKKDERGIEIVTQAEKIGCRTLTAESGSIIKGADILREVEELAEIAKNQNKMAPIEKDEKLNVVFVKGVKGGVGTTTAMAVISQLLKQQGENVKIYDPSNGCSYLSSDVIESLLIKEQQFPTNGWLVTENLEIELNADHELYRILIVDPSNEALARGKNEIKDDDFLIINRAVPDVLPNEIYTGEFRRVPDLIVPYNPTPYLLSDWESIFMDWEPVIKLLKERR